MKTTKTLLMLVVGLAGGGALAAGKAGAELDGAWDTGCIGKARTRIEYKDLRLKGTYTMFSDDACTQPLSVNTWTGHSELKGAAPVKGAKKIDVHFDSFKATALNEQAAAGSNKSAYCGISDWKAGEERDVLGKECKGFSVPTGGVNPDIFRIDADTLAFGKGSKISAKAKESDRPRELNTGWTFSRQK